MKFNLFNNFTRWILFTSALLFGAAFYGLYEGGFQHILETQHSFIALSVLGMLLANIAYMGREAFNSVKLGTTPHIAPAFFYAEISMGAALLGSVLGMMEVFSVFKSVGTADIKKLIIEIGAGTGTAQITLLCGIGAAVVLRLALALIFGAYSQKGE